MKNYSVLHGLFFAATENKISSSGKQYFLLLKTSIQATRRTERHNDGMTRMQQIFKSGDKGEFFRQLFTLHLLFVFIRSTSFYKGEESSTTLHLLFTKRLYHF